MKKGFTLIELLATIVILSIVVMISSPIIKNVINDSKNNLGVSNSQLIYDTIIDYCDTKDAYVGLSENLCTGKMTPSDLKDVLNFGDSEILEMLYVGDKLVWLKVLSNNQIFISENGKMIEWDNEKKFNYSYYNTLKTAIDASNNKTFDVDTSEEMLTSKVLGYNIGNTSNILLLDNVIEETRTSISSDVNIDLNGKTVNYTNTHVGIDILNSASVNIDGSKEKSLISIENSDVSTKMTKLFQIREASKFNIIGGTYIAKSNINTPLTVDFYTTVIHNGAGILNLDNANIIADSKFSKCIGIQNDTGNITVNKSEIKSYSNLDTNFSKSGAYAVLNKKNFFSNDSLLKSNYVTLSNQDTMEINNSKLYSSHNFMEIINLSAKESVNYLKNVEFYKTDKLSNYVDDFNNSIYENDIILRTENQSSAFNLNINGSNIDSVYVSNLNNNFIGLKISNITLNRVPKIVNSANKNFKMSIGKNSNIIDKTGIDGINVEYTEEIYVKK